KAKWPGWPGFTVFRVVVPVLKVGSIIGRKGDLIKKMVEETRARVRVLDGPNTSPDRIVLISGKEEPDAVLPPAMDATFRIFKRINGLPENEDVKVSDAAAGSFCSIRFLVPSTQAVSLIGKQGVVIKAIQENTGASVRVLSSDELPVYADSDERIIELQGDVVKVIPALESVLGHLRKFLVDFSVLPLFEKNYLSSTSQERPSENWSEKALMLTAPQASLASDYPGSLSRDSLYFDRESQLESLLKPSRLSLYADHALGGHSSALEIGNRSSSLAGRFAGPVVTQVAQTMQIPLIYAEDIIGIQGANIDYIRRTSGAILTVQESVGLPDEITVEIKGASTQVQIAQQLIQEFTGHRDNGGGSSSSFGKMESTLRASNSQIGGGGGGGGGNAYMPPSSLPTQRYGAAYASSSTGTGAGYNNFR
ncbi:hypothetical protein M569_00398, partial [Genlisea aurea]